MRSRRQPRTKNRIWSLVTTRVLVGRQWLCNPRYSLVASRWALVVGCKSLFISSWCLLFVTDSHASICFFYNTNIFCKNKILPKKNSSFLVNDQRATTRNQINSPIPPVYYYWETLGLKTVYGRWSLIADSLVITHVICWIPVVGRWSSVDTHRLLVTLWLLSFYLLFYQYLL